LYRDALSWRSQLSLANRRYLEGYCIANGVIDSYGIPLPWSRFALKLYLQAVKFVLIEKPTAGAAGAEAKQEYYDQNDNTAFGCRAQYWLAQTFTPQVSHNLTKIAIKANRTDPVATCIVGIRATSLGKPTGGDLVAPTNFSSGLFQVASPGNWAEITLTTPLDVENGTMYAIVIRNPTGNGLGRLYWRIDTTATYPRGTEVTSGDSGVVWSIVVGSDMMFEEWGSTPPGVGVLGLLHVRHPSLLTLIHKRGGLNINGYDTLSSLDGEYLTGQVGLDVDSDDFIEATTLPGIKYPYVVP